MNSTMAREGLRNMERLRKIVALAEEASPALKRRGELSRRHLEERQEKSLALIMSEPDSKAYRDYIETLALFGVPVPEGFPKVPKLAEIMAEKKCGRNKAKTYQAMMQIDADEVFFKKTGRHFLSVSPSARRKTKARA